MSALPRTWLDRERTAVGLLQSQRMEDAERETREAIRLNPAEARLHMLLTHALFWQGKLEEAEQASWHAFQLAPPNRQLTVQLANFYLGNWDFGRARRFAVEAVNRQPQSVPARLLLIRSWLGSNQGEAALEAAQRARADLGDLPELLTEQADVFDLLGQTDRAKELYEASLRINPLQGKPYYALSNTASPGDAVGAETVRAVLSDPATPKSEHPYLHWTLGRFYERLGDFESAMTRYDAANTLSAEIHQVRGNSSKDVEAVVAERKAAYSSDWLRAAEAHGNPSETPIFIVGMMRSGTTLVEQILSRHPEVGTVGEQPFWTIHGRRAVAPDQLDSLAASYLSLLRDRDPHSSRVVDKMPSNYLRLGLIAAAFPKATIVHVQRDPVDTCLSLWSTPRALPVDWGFSKTSVVSHYRAYRELMRYWTGQLGESRILRLSYEDLVSNPNEEIRRLLEFCHLAWHEDCLFPERSGSLVTTPSSAQVRRPIHKDSLNRREGFFPWLGEFTQLTDRL